MPTTGSMHISFRLEVRRHLLDDVVNRRHRDAPTMWERGNGSP